MVVAMGVIGERRAAFRRFGDAGLRRRVLTGSPPAPERRFMPLPVAIVSGEAGKREGPIGCPQAEVYGMRDQVIVANGKPQARMPGVLGSLAWGSATRRRGVGGMGTTASSLTIANLAAKPPTSTVRS